MSVYIESLRRLFLLGNTKREEEQMSNEMLSKKGTKKTGGRGYSRYALIPFVKLFLEILRDIENSISRVQCQDGE